MEWVIGLLAIVVTIAIFLIQRRSPQRVEVVKLPEPDTQPTEGHTAESAPVPAENGTYVALNGRTAITLPREALGSEGSKYSQWAGDMRLANRDGQLVSVVADFRHPAERFDSKEKFLLPTVLSKYLDVHGFKPPLVMQDYAEFEFLPRPDGRRVWLRADREGVLAIEVWRSWPQVPWDWLLAEAYSSLLCLGDDRLMSLFQVSNIVQVALTLGNLLGPGGTTPDVNVTTRGLGVNLVPPGEEVRGVQPRFQSVQHECGSADTDPWGCAKAFVKKALANTGVLLFEEHFEAVGKDQFLNMYFETPGSFSRPQASVMNESQALGNRLKSLMAERGVTPLMLASSSGVSAHELSQYLNGEMLPDADLLSRMASALNVSLADLRSV
jgi:hypothetical protein